jgi:hypothetical protein
VVELPGVGVVRPLPGEPEALLVGIFAYARVLGTEQVMEVSQA